jgi:hypothetical protein
MSRSKQRLVLIALTVEAMTQIARTHLLQPVRWHQLCQGRECA